MCLELNKKKLTPRYTIKDKVVYKILNVKDGIIESPFYDMEYKLNVLYQSELMHGGIWRYFWSTEHKNKLPIMPRPKFDIYTDNMWYIKELCPSYYELQNVIEQGLHSFSNVSRAMKYAFKKIDTYRTVDVFLFEGVIPKGSWYYENEDGEIASDQIIINKKLFELCV